MSKNTVTVASDLKNARELLKETRELVKTLSAKEKAEKAALKADREAAKVAKTQARVQRMTERKAALEAALAKMANVGKGAAKARAAVRKPSAVQIIKPAA